MVVWSAPYEILVTDPADDTGDDTIPDDTVPDTCTEEGATTCECGPNGLTQYTCMGGVWVETGECECGDADIFCMLQKFINSEFNQCVEYPLVVGLTIGVGAIVLGMVLTSARL